MAGKPSKMLDANLGHGGRSRSPSASSDNGLPPYADTASTVQDDVIPPETLLLAGTTIHSTASITSPPLYELSLALGHLTPSHQKVELSRLDYHVRRAGASAATAGDRGPEVAARQKHLYNLSRPTAIMQSNFPFYLESVRRSNLGHVGFKKRHKMAGSTEYRALRVTRPNGVAGELKGGDVLFSIKATAAGRWEWREGEKGGPLLAYDTYEDGIVRLQIVEPMAQSRRDALVGTWCLRVWWDLVASKEPLLTWEQVKPLFEPGIRQYD
ncbi:hypothetical protein D7B24_003733 [Verticillium nonalfalfae]|uniref:Uncharacterized protein n=1 Tax=Verticillium nonalfalfae TaxID=1051616 RepID=A0A3M9XWJ0_9PEZI|nr:uncharacterized protein D7B24_003733 [Verticillium nonalfalfae]RNJ52391.1 hypothetical protein D7B24_003733 [Verticillium nonalfalfae]